MEQGTKRRLFAAIRPPLLALGFVVKLVYIVLFTWWFNPWARRKANAALLDDIKAELAFVVSQDSAAIAVIEDSWPTAQLSWSNLLFTIVRWRGETTVSVAPRSAPTQSYELGPVIAALERRHLSEHDVVNDLSDAANLLRPRLQALNAAFSAQDFPHILPHL